MDFRFAQFILTITRLYLWSHTHFAARLLVRVSVDLGDRDAKLNLQMTYISRSVDGCV